MKYKYICTLVIHLVKQTKEGGEKKLSFLGSRGGQKPCLMHVVLCNSFHFLDPMLILQFDGLCYLISVMDLKKSLVKVCSAVVKKQITL